jgi:hypothetical protein
VWSSMTWRRWPPGPSATVNSQWPVISSILAGPAGPGRPGRGGASANRASSQRSGLRIHDLAPVAQDGLLFPHADAARRSAAAANPPNVPNVRRARLPSGHGRKRS